MTKEELRDFLKKHNLTQIKFAQLIGKKRGTIHRWINGNSVIPPYVEFYIKNIEKDLDNAAEILKKIELKKED